MKSLLLSLLTPLLLLTPIASAARAEHHVSSAEELIKLDGTLKPGDTIVLSDGTWKDQRILFRGEGTEQQPITLRAQTPGKVILTGKSSVTINGQYLLVSGLLLKDGGAGEGKSTDGIAVIGHHNRLTDSAVVGGTYKFLVHLYGDYCQLDHCYIAGKASGDPTLQIEAPGEPNYDHIEYNHFGHRKPLGRNGGETMRVGYSWQSMNNSRTLVEHNLFERCDGEIEIISSKSCENTYRCNTFLDCAGTLTLRHGNRCIVDSNFFIAHHKKGSGGIRVIGEDHVVVNNYIDGVVQGGFWITAGWEQPILKSYFAARNCLIAYNTVVDSGGTCVDLSAGLATTVRTVLPQNITLANNLFSPDQTGSMLKGKTGPGLTVVGNLVAAGAKSADMTGINLADLALQRAPDGLWRPTSQSPAHAAARGSFPMVKTDIDGQPRTSRSDIGCDQMSDAPITNKPLKAEDVGPSWLPVSARND